MTNMNGASQASSSQATILHDRKRWQTHHDARSMMQRTVNDQIRCERPRAGPNPLQSKMPRGHTSRIETHAIVGDRQRNPLVLSRKPYVYFRSTRMSANVEQRFLRNPQKHVLHLRRQLLLRQTAIERHRQTMIRLESLNQPRDARAQTFGA